MDETAPGVTELAPTADTDATPPVAELPASTAEPGDRQLDPQYIPFQRVVGWIVTASTAACTLAAVAVYWLAADLPAWAGALLLLGWVMLTVGTGWLSYAWPPIHYRHTSYRLDDEGIEIRSGVWWREIVSVPRSRVQHIDVSQGPMERSVRARPPRALYRGDRLLARRAARAELRRRVLAQAPPASPK